MPSLVQRHPRIIKLVYARNSLGTHRRPITASSNRGAVLPTSDSRDDSAHSRFFLQIGFIDLSVVLVLLRELSGILNKSKCRRKRKTHRKLEPESGEARKMDIGFSSYHNGGPAREQDFGRLSQTVGTSILKISQNVSSMQKMVNQLGGSTDSQELRNQLHQIQHYTQQLAKDTNVHLRDLAALATNSASSSPGEQRQRKMQKERLQDEFTSALNSFQAVQRLAASKEKEMVRKAKASAGFGAFGEKKQETLIELQDNRTQKQIQQQHLQDEQNLRMLEEQEASIRQLESDINDVNQIFKDLGALVHDQGEVIDSIESSVERTEVFVNEGAQQLRTAATYSNKLRKKKCILVIIGAIVLSILVGIIAWQTS